MKARKALRRSRPQSEASEEIFHLLFHLHPRPMWVYDLETLAFLEVNDAALEKYGYAREEFLKMTLKDIRPSEDVTRLLDIVAKMRIEREHSGEWRHTLRNGRTIDVEVTTHTLAYHGRKAALVIVQDITAKKDAEKVIQESDIHHRSLFENMMEGFAYCRMVFENDKPVDFEYLEVNSAFEKITGLKDVVGKRVTEAIPGIRESNPELFEIYGRVAQTGQPERFEVYVNPLDTWFSISVYTLHQGHFAAVFTDITDRKRAEDQGKRLNRMYAVLSNINEAIVRIHDPHQLLEEACRIAVDDGQFKLAWIGMVNPDTRKVEVAALKVATDAYLDKTAIDLNDDQRNGGPTGKAILTGTDAISNDIEHDALMLPWREYALKLSFRSSASFPLKASGETRGALSLYAAEVDFFNEDELRLLNELAKDVSFAIEFNRQESERKRVQKALSESERRFHELFDEAPVGYHELDIQGRIVEVNRTELEMLGYKTEEMLRHPAWDFIVEGETSREAIAAKIAGSTPSDRTFERTFRRKDGTTLNVLVKDRALRNEAGEVVGIRSTLQDITDRKQVEQTLRESEERYRALVTFSPDSLYVHVDNRVTLVNPAICQLLGADDPSQLIGKSVFEIVHPEYHEKVRERLNLVFGGQPAPLVEEKFIRLDGTVVDVEVSAVAIDWQGTKGVQVIARDITERKRADEAVKDSEERFRMVFDHVFDGISIYSEDPDPSKRRLVDCNDRYAAMAGRSREELLQLGGTLGLQITLEDTANAIRLDSLTKGTAYQGSFSWIRADGKDNVIEYVGVPITWQGKSYTIGIDRDITERKKAERELRLMAQTVASVQDCISITDLEDRFLFVNDAFRNTYGYTTEELLGKEVSILRSPHSQAAITDQILHDTLGGRWHGELLNRRKDGSDLSVELWTSIVRDESGIPVALVGVARDITDRKKAEEHLRQSEELFRLIAENVGDMIAVVDLDGRRIYNSSSYKSILGDPESLKGTDGFQEIHPEDRDRVKRVFRETVRTGVGQRIEYRLIRKDGSVSLIDSKGSLIRDNDGKISRVIVVSRDVTEEKKLAAQFLRAQRMESIGTLAGGIAHDLNNVLTPIMMAIEVLRKKLPDPGGQKILNTLETSAKRGSDIVKQVLAFGRGAQGDRILVQIKHVVNEVVKIAGGTLPKSIEIKTDIPRDLWTVSADPTQMHQVLLNMLVNARDAMPNGGTLTISAENVKLDENYARMHLEAKLGAYVSIAITDTGTGIPADIREKIFEPFFTTKEIGKGTGLGLSTTLAIVKSHEGFINLYSEVGKGTTFRIYIPATGTASRAAAASEEADLPMGNGELILVIDDEAAIREITKETLQAYGYEVLSASDGAEGVAVFAENKKTIKAVITDIMMPVMDGTAAIRALQRINPDVKIIAASGLTAKGQITTPSDANVQAVLTKPYTAEKLLKALAALLR